METTVTTTATTEVDIGLGKESREGTIKILTALLADEYILYTKTKNYHWNVTGPDFNELHEFFGKQYEELDEMVDEIAERIRQLGGYATGTLAEFISNARIKEEPGRYPDARVMLSNLLSDHEHIIRAIRVDAETVAGKYSDMGTNDFLIGIMQKHEKMAWMLRAYLE
ncbi:MAG: DNA starvation/stationary phase protection protein [Candidatus Nitrosocaldus sp.]|nr:DNA starvation/stationary phase protection protein [Candidatus Nitrosocaldus sp.]MDW8276138.1 DNA starvation/stationary phase protection protein [Candidatus Nitrosocaldus sp.]